jgi:hypothetical protein
VTEWQLLAPGDPEPERDRVLNAIRGYFNLCSEEFFVFKRGKIDREASGNLEARHPGSPAPVLLQ